MQLRTIPLSQLEPHPLNSNVMPPRVLKKLAANMARTGKYPPVVVRRLGGEGEAGTSTVIGRAREAASGGAREGAGGERYQILDGHHRVEALRMNGCAAARCVVWDVDDREAMLLLATLNRLEGGDDPRKRAALVAKLHELPDIDTGELARSLPEDAAGLNRLLELNASPPPKPVSPDALADMPVSIHFFLSRDQRNELEATLRELGGQREEALMRMVRGFNEAETGRSCGAQDSEGLDA